MALGAAGREVGRAVMGPALAPSVAGIALGSGAAIVLGRLLHPDLYEVGPSDPLTYSLVAFILLGAAAIACAIPALRASRIDPVVALRSE
jgi:ABC-type antimicrobial peptide transport system permease subunit